MVWEQRNEERKLTNLEYLLQFITSENEHKRFLTLDIETRFGDIEHPYKGKKALKLDLEKLNPWEHEILLFQIGNVNTQFIVDCRSTDLLPVINTLKECKNLTIVGHNLKYDIKWLNVKYGYIPEKMFDTMVVEKCLTLGKYDLVWDVKKKSFVSYKAYSLNEVAKRHLNFDYDNAQLNLFEPRASKKIRDGFPGVKNEKITEVQLTYAKYDVIIPSMLYLKYKKRKLPRVVDLENEYLKVIITMESEGIYLDADAWTENYYNNESKIYNILEKLNKYGEINWNSPKQKLDVLASLGIVPKDKHGKITTGKAVLSRIDHEITEMLTEMSVYKKLSSSFGLNTLSLVNKKSKKLHTSFNQMVSNSRLSSSNPNLQQIPRGEEYRKPFYHPEGLTVCDFSNMEIRRIAELANETALIEALNKGLDVHLETAKRMFDLEGKDAKYIKEKRDIGKTLNFSLLYGISAFNLSYKYKVSEKEAQSWIDNFFKAYPNIKKFLTATRKQCLKTGKLKIDKFDRYYYFPQWERYKQLEQELDRQKKLGLPLNRVLFTEFKKLEGDIEREAGNYIVSGSCATVNKIAGIYLYKKGIKQLLAVHDENIVKGDFREEVVEAMGSAWAVLNHRVGMPLEAGYAKNWTK